MKKDTSKMEGYFSGACHSRSWNEGGSGHSIEFWPTSFFRGGCGTGFGIRKQALFKTIIDMITQYEVPSLLKEELPTIASDQYPARFTMDIYKSVQCFSDYTKHAVMDHNMQLAKKCFALAGKIYRNGDNIVKNVIENTFVFSFTSFMPKDRIEKLILQSIIPAALYTVYMKQVMGSGC